MDSSLTDLTEFLETSKELLGVIDNISLANASSRSQKSTSGQSTVFVTCPNYPKNHGRIPQGSLEKHLKKCNRSKESSPGGHIGYDPATRLKPLLESRQFYRHVTNEVATTIVYKDKLSSRQQKLISPKELVEDASGSVGALKDAGLFQLRSSQVYLYNPPGSTPKSPTPTDLRSSKEKNQAYSEHIRLQDLITQTKVLKEEPTSASTCNEGKDSAIKRDDIMERMDEIRRQRNMEQRSEREMAQKKLGWDRKKRRRGYKSESARAEKKTRHMIDPAGKETGGSGDEESEAIRKALAKGKSGAWAAAIEVFLRDAQLVATAQSELREEFVKRCWGNSGNQSQRQRSKSKDGRRVKGTRSPEPPHPERRPLMSPEPHRPRIEDERHQSPPSHGKTVK